MAGIQATIKEAGEHYRAGRFQEAAHLLEALLDAAPELARGWFLLGIVEGSRGRPADAAGRLHRAAELAPDDVEIRHFLAKALARNGQFADASLEYRRVIARAPGHAAARSELGTLLLQQGDADAAVECHRAALAADSQSVGVLNNLGAALRAANRPAEAISTLRRALELAPGHPEVLLNLGNALKDLGRFEEAANAFSCDAGTSPQGAALAAGQGIVLARLGRIAEAITALERAVSIDPGNAGALGRLIREKEQACDWSAVDDLTRQARALTGGDGLTIHPFVWLSRTEDPAEQRAAAERLAARAVASSPQPTHAPRTSGGPIRLGYLSTDFHNHATAHLLVEVIELHDRRDFHVTAYSAGPDDGSAARRRLCAAFDDFADIAGLSDARAADLIREDHIDVLIDLKGWTHNARTGVVARRPAPIVVNYLGYPGTMGGRLADYIVGDPAVTPLSDAENFSERLVLLPHTYQPNDRRRQIGPAVSRESCGLPPGGTVLCAFNQPYKFTREMFDVWCEALDAAPHTVLWVLTYNPLMIDNLRRELSARAISPERLIAAPLLPLDRHLARLACADLFLDTFPCNAHTTASDALWSGVPVLTRAGRTFASRVAASLLRAAGMHELVTDSIGAYRERLLALVSRPPEIAALKAQLRATRDRVPLFDSQRYTGNLERAFRAIWDRHVRGLPPDHLVVDDGTA